MAPPYFGPGSVALPDELFFTSRRVVAEALRLPHREDQIEPPRTEPARPMQRTSR